MRIGAAVPLLAALVIVEVSARTDPLEAAWQRLESYRAEYHLRQSEPSANAGELAVEGKLLFDVRIACPEVATSLVMNTRMLSGGRTVAFLVEQRSVETRDGKSLRFSHRASIDGRVVAEAEGEANLQSREGPGEAVLKGSAAESLKIPQGTVLIGTHSLRMLAAAAAGTRAFEDRVLLGVVGWHIAAIRVSVLGRGRSPKGEAFGDFADKPGWSIRKDQVVLNGPSAGTAQMQEFFVTEEGVTTSLGLSIMGIRLVGAPVSIQKLPKAECRS